ncbi:hypothetical protein C5167_033084 [Papaver somniferum]|uniref:Rad21/Rec8-like protein C-terminal eukaryotic domain-containing protein n=1 Tax=Papaver somniferum TaxID=3469 RepID=A0A4Y7KDA2_PAPSO|nr:hypothetical protein C5167_033084 [Papaver somniferum]
MDRDTSPQELIPDSSNSQVEEDVPETCIPQEIPEIEVVRDADPNLSLAEKSSEHLSISREQSESVQHNPDPPTAFAPVESFGNGRVSDIAFGNESFQIAIYPTPQDEKEKPKTRKRKQFFDMHIVLDNESQIIGPGDVQENAGANARTSVPDFDMEIDNEQPNVDKEVLPDVGTEVEHIPPVVEAETEHLRPDDNPEIEYGRFEDGSADRDFTTEFMATPTPFKTSRFEHQTGNWIGMDESASFSNTPGLLDSAGAVAQYLENHSPATETSQDQIGSLSLNKILHGKTRKQCAQIFFEILVLAKSDYVNVHQEEAYGDISLTLTSRLKTPS